jgi:light-regulated signal transduction histidine kinase (bacteriophytochrome)
MQIVNTNQRLDINTGPESNHPDLTIRLLEARMAELVREYDQFAYIVSHDLQAPLRSITGFLELIEKRYGDKLDDAGKQYIDFALKGSQKIKTLIMDLLEYSRLNSVDFQVGQVDLTEILQEVSENMNELIKKSGSQVEISGLPVVRGNRKLLVLLFTHLLDNAIKFKGEVAPKILIYSSIMPGNLLIRVKDNGMGIAPAFLEKIFVIFRKLNPNEQIYPGTGKGLAICKKIIALHGWAISADSKEGEGTEITISIKD